MSDADPWFKTPGSFVTGGALAGIKTLGELKVLTALRHYTNVASGGLAWPGLTTLAADTGMARGNVARAIRQLINGGLIERVSAGDRNGATTRYRVLGSGPGATPVGIQLVARAQQGSGPGATEVVARAQQGSGPGAAQSDEEQTIDQTSEQTSTPQPPPGAARARAGADALPGFDRFWAAYPAGERKVNRGKCRDKWRAMGLEPVADRVLAGLDRWRASEAWAREAGRFVPLPMTWLNQRRWEVEHLTPAEPDEDGFVRRPMSDEEFESAMGPPDWTTLRFDERHDDPLFTAAVVAAMRDWGQHLKQKGKAMSWPEAKGLVADFRQWGHERTVAAVRHSIRSGWTSVHEPKENDHATVNGNRGHQHRGTVEGLRL